MVFTILNQIDQTKSIFMNTNATYEWKLSIKNAYDSNKIYFSNLQSVLFNFGENSFDEPCIKEFALMCKVKDDWVAFYLARCLYPF